VPAKIRSNYRRRLLTTLSISGCSVSEAAQKTGLRLPHASAELKKLRGEGHVSADREGESRGSHQRLTSSGMKLLESDELARLKQVLKTGVPSEAQGCIVARDGESLLLAYAVNPGKGILLIPNQGMEIISDSSGNQGDELEFSWVTPVERRIRWFDSKTLEPTQAPESGQSMQTLAAWTEANQVIGLIRGRTLDYSKSENLAVGTWFKKPKMKNPPPLPNLLRDGDWNLGEAHESAKPVKPEVPLVAVVQERYAASLLTNAASEGAWVLSDRAESNPIPISVLQWWIREVHPRLPAAELRDRLSQVQKAAVSGWRGRRRRSRLTTTWQRFRESWQDVEWQEEPIYENPASFNIQSLDSLAVKSLMHWIIEDAKQPLVLNWPTHRDFDENKFGSLLNNGLNRLLITPHEINSPSLVLVEGPEGWPDSRLRLPTNIEIPILLAEQKEELIAPPDNWTRPWKPSDIIPLSESFDLVKTPDDELEALWVACSLFPEGEENWANRHESKFPLAAWIASSQEHRWSRWQRISRWLNSEWIELLPPEEVPFSELVKLLARATPEWRIHASQVIRKTIVLQPDAVIEMRRWCKEKSDAAVCAEQILAVAPWIIPHLGKAMAVWAYQAWQAYPTQDIGPVLEGMKWCACQGFLKKSWSKPIEEVAINLRSGHPLRHWLSILKWTTDGKAMRLDSMRNSFEALPLDWWAHLSIEALSRQLEDEDGRSWLLEQPISWAAACLRPPTEEGRLPGADSQHPGMDMNLVVSIRHHFVNLENEKGEGSSHLLDLIESIEDLEQGSAVKCGRTHPAVSWLVRPVDEWGILDLTPEGFSCDEMVQARLDIRVSGFHSGLLESTQARLP